MIYTVTIAQDVSEYADIQVEARSIEEALSKVQADFEENGWDSEYYVNAIDWQADASASGNLRIVS